MSTAAAALPVPSPKADFADWLSPILVKELRQGLKSRAFVSSFIVVQTLMIVLVGMQLIARAGGMNASANDGFGGFFWAVIMFSLLMLMPARGLSAVSEETKANTFDLVQLTRLTAFRIVAGKWLALVAQTFLLVTSILPYAVLRYYFGGVDVVTELVAISLALAASLVLTAGAICLSTAHVAVRILVLIAVLPMVSTMLSAYSAFRAFGGSRSGIFTFGVMPASMWWIFYAVSAVYVVVLLEFAAATLAPLCENHAARKRSMALGIALAGLLTVWLSGDHEETISAIGFTMPLLLWLVVDALSEARSALPALYAPFARRGLLGRVAGRVLYPGWATGVLFAAFVLAIIFLSVGIYGHARPYSRPESTTYYVTWMLIFLSLLSPLPVMFLFPRVKQRFWLYVLTQLIFLLMFFAANIAADGRYRGDDAAFKWLCIFPTSALVALMGRSSDYLASYYLSTTGIVGMLLLGFLLLLMLRDFRFIAHLERVSLGAGKRPR